MGRRSGKEFLVRGQTLTLVEIEILPQLNSGPLVYHMTQNSEGKYCFAVDDGVEGNKIDEILFDFSNDTSTDNVTSVRKRLGFHSAVFPVFNQKRDRKFKLEAPVSAFVHDDSIIVARDH